MFLRGLVGQPCRQFREGFMHIRAVMVGSVAGSLDEQPESMSLLLFPMLMSYEFRVHFVMLIIRAPRPPVHSGRTLVAFGSQHICQHTSGNTTAKNYSKFCHCLCTAHFPETDKIPKCGELNLEIQHLVTAKY